MHLRMHSMLFYSHSIIYGGASAKFSHLFSLGVDFPPSVPFIFKKSPHRDEVHSDRAFRMFGDSK